MKLRATPDGLIAHDARRDRWVRLPGDSDMLALLTERATARERAAAAIAADDAVEADPVDGGNPVPAALDARVHALGVARDRLEPDAGEALLPDAGGEGRQRASSGSPASTFPKLKPNERFWEAPTFYVANHTMVLADGEEMWWPSHTKALDFELELACVLRQAARRRDARGGARRRSAAGSSSTTGARATCRPTTPAATSSARSSSRRRSPTRSAATSSPPTQFRDWTQATGRVRVDGELWCEGATAEPGARRRRDARLRLRGRAPRRRRRRSRPGRCPAAAGWSSTAGSSPARPSSSRSTASEP